MENKFIENIVVEKDLRSTGVKNKINTYTNGFTVTANNHTCLLNGSSFSVTAMLPQLTSDLDGLILVFKAKNVTNTVMLTTSGGNTFDDGNTTYTLTLVNEVYKIQGDFTTGIWEEIL